MTVAQDIQKEQLKNNQIPVVDFGGFIEGTPEIRKATGQKIYKAFRDVGFVYLINHGVPQEKVDRAFKESKTFFNLTPEQKAKCPHPPGGDHHRGYSGLGLEKVSQMVFDDEAIQKLRQKPDLKESFDMGREDDNLMPNIWPDEADMPGFRNFFNEFFDICSAAQQQIMRAIALGVNLPSENFFDSYHLERDYQCRLLYYPPTPLAALQSGESERLAAHSDFGSLTLLFQDDNGGLEVESPKTPGEFVAAPYIPGACVVNIGDFLMRWSNDELKSTLHRVRAPPGAADASGMTKPRYSIPFFTTADMNKTIECLPGCWGPDRPKKYEPVSAKEYILARLNATY